MSPRTLHSIAGGQSAAPARQMSHANPFSGRGRGAIAARRVQAPDMGMWRADFQDRWARLIRAQFASVSDAAQFFDVTEQAVRYWLSGHSRPHGDVVAAASAMWPEAYARYLIEGRR